MWRLGRLEEAIVAYDELIARFADANEPLLRELVEKARRIERPGTTGA